MKYDLAQRLYFGDVALGDRVSPELLLAHRSLIYFVAGLLDVDPHQLTLGHLVRHLQQREPQHPLRRSSDPPLPLRHPSSCGCAICGQRRRRVNA